MSTELCSCIRDERDGLDRRVHAGGEDYIHGETLNPPAWTDACCLDLSAVRATFWCFTIWIFFLGGGVSDTSSSSSSASKLMYNMPDIFLSQSPAFAPCLGSRLRSMWISILPSGPEKALSCEKTN